MYTDEEAMIEAKAIKMHDAVVVGAMVELLQTNPWPSSDPRWAIIEQWGKEFVARFYDSSTEAKP